MLDGEPGEAGQCPICKGHFESLQLHHIVPQSTRAANLTADEGEGPTILLCASCHFNLHNQARSAIAKNPKKTCYFSPFEMANIANLRINTANGSRSILDVLIASELRAKETPSLDQERKVTLEFTNEELSMLHMAKMDNGYSSLATFLHALILGKIKTATTPSSKSNILTRRRS